MNTLVEQVIGFTNKMYDLIQLFNQKSLENDMEAISN